ncbi:MFS transporter [Puniceicoccales bacterium CK1056]|uniref:MFS transporter n=1 Tax=Oceanipulchritudo coccoides TaxID=2706888 RepID=A0A6B2LXY8_9BACT|nr:MFS transporter [Oceanipulchritudo coccoides]NDV60982.1 MFS transporter [Oceanipulchritudo coccoides]
MNPQNGKLSILEKVGYGAGDTASNIFYQAFNIVLFYYYTDVWGISPIVVGWIYLGARLWDAINDPLMGIIADRTQTRMGRYRPYLLWLAIPFGLIGFLTFASPGLEGSLKIIYAASTYTVLGMIYTAINVPYSALMGVMTPDTEERTILASYRFVGAFSAALIIGATVRPLANALGGGDEVLGYRLTFALLGGLASLLFIFTFLTTKERLAPEKAGADTRVGRDLKILLKNTPWIIMAFAGFLTLSNVAIRAAVTFHYFKYYVGDTGERYFWWMDLTSFFLSTGSIAFIVGILFTNILRKKFGKRNSLIGMTLLNALVTILFFFISPDNIAVMLIANLLGSFFAGPTPALVWAMYTDVADYGELKYGRRTTGLVFSSAIFAQKMGLMIGGVLSGWILGWVGFVANAEQTPGSLMGIRVMFCFIPGAFAIANGLVLFLYPITEEQVLEMEEELNARREARESGEGAIQPQ